MCCFLELYSQNNCTITLEGYVTDYHDKSPLEGAVINLYSHQKTTQTDANGYFRFENLCEGFYQLEVGHIDCPTQFIDLDLEENERLQIKLEHHYEELQNVVVTGMQNKTETVPTKILDATMIENNTTESLAEVLERIPGVSSLNSW